MHLSYLVFEEKNQYEQDLSNVRKRNNARNENRCKGEIESARKKTDERKRKKGK